MRNVVCRQVAQLMVSSYDPVLGKTIWQCAQCHYSSKLRCACDEIYADENGSGEDFDHCEAYYHKIMGMIMVMML